MIGKSMYIWDIASIRKGDPAAIVGLLQEGRFQSAILHHQNLQGWRTGARVALVNALQNAGIEPVLGAAVYGGADSQLEGLLAANICNDYGLASLILDIEAGEYENKTTGPTSAEKTLTTIRSITPGISIGWCSWAQFHAPGKPGTIWHPIEVVRTGMKYADFGMPMVYWSGTSSASVEAYLSDSFAQWREHTGKPIIPAGRAYTGDGGTPTAVTIQAFEAQARRLFCPGVSWWSMQHALGLAGIWDVLAGLPGFGEQPPAEEAMLNIKYHITAAVQNVRCGPGTNYAVLSRVSTGQVVSGVDDIVANSASDVWLKIHSVGGWLALVNGGTYYLQRVN